jgi:hypothetical protein
MSGTVNPSQSLTYTNKNLYWYIGMRARPIQEQEAQKTRRAEEQKR